MTDADFVPAEALTYEQAIANLRQRQDTGLRYYAAWWLGRFRMAEPEAIALLIDALDDELDRAPDGGYPLRRNAARALGKLGSVEAVLPLVAALACDDYYVREAAAESLGELGDARAVERLADLLAGGVAAAVKVEGKPHLTQPYASVLEALGKLGATGYQLQIEEFLHHEQDKIRFSAGRALYQLTAEARYAELVAEGLTAPDLQRRRAALMDVGAIGYLPAAERVAATLAENSLKLISMRGLLLAALPPADQPLADLDPTAARVMDLMDALL